MKYFGLLIVFYSGVTFSTAYSYVTTISGISVGENYVRVKLSEMNVVEGCVDQNWYVLDTTNQTQEIFFSSLLSANAANMELSLQLTGCHQAGIRSYPKITHVYLCDTQYCN